MDYWKVCIYEAFEDAEIEATDDQKDTIISWVEGAYENFSLATGLEAIPSPLETELLEIKAELKKEQSKVQCSTCNGNGWLRSQGPCHSSESECYTCRGEGRVVR